MTEPTGPDGKLPLPVRINLMATLTYRKIYLRLKKEKTHVLLPRQKMMGLKMISVMDSYRTNFVASTFTPSAASTHVVKMNNSTRMTQSRKFFFRCSDSSFLRCSMNSLLAMAM